MDRPAKRQRVDPRHAFDRSFDERYRFHGSSDARAALEHGEFMDAGYEEEELYGDEEEDGLDTFEELQQKRATLDGRLKSTFESIFEKYEKDFDGIGDEIDLYTGAIVVNNGHLLDMQHERDTANSHRSGTLRGLTGNSNGEETDGSEAESEEHLEDRDDDQGESDLDHDGYDSDKDNDNGGAELSVDEEMIEDDIILRGVPQQRLEHTYPMPRMPSLELVPNTRVLLSGAARPRSALSNSDRRDATPLEADLLQRFGPKVGPEIYNYISEQRLLDDEHSDIEPAWRAPSIPRLPERRMSTAAWRTPRLRSATPIHRPLLKSVLTRTEIERTPTPEMIGSVWDPERVSTLRPRGSSTGPRKPRCTFTSDEDALIVETISNARRQGLLPSSWAVWQQVALEHPRHATSTWKKRCVEKFSHLLSQSTETGLSSENDFGSQTTKPVSNPAEARMLLAENTYTASHTRPASPARAVSQRPSRLRRPADRNFGLISWTDAAATIEKQDPELHARILEDSAGFESSRNYGYQTSGSSEIKSVDKENGSSPILPPMPLLPQARTAFAVPSNSRATRAIPDSQDESDLPSSPCILRPKSADNAKLSTSTQNFGRNIIDPSYCFSDDDDDYAATVAKHSRRRTMPSAIHPRPASRRYSSVLKTTAKTHTPAKHVGFKLPRDDEEIICNEAVQVQKNLSLSPKADRHGGNAFPESGGDEHVEVYSSSPISASELISPLPEQIAGLPTISTPNDRSSEKTISCPRAKCEKTFTKPWYLKLHLRAHKTEDARLLAEAAPLSTKSRSGFLDWDDFDELSLGPDDFVVAPVISKPLKGDTPLAIRLKREGTAGFTPAATSRSIKMELQTDQDQDLDDIDELAGDSVPPLSGLHLGSSVRASASTLKKAKTSRMKPVNVPVDKTTPVRPVPAPNSAAQILAHTSNTVKVAPSTNGAILESGEGYPCNAVTTTTNMDGAIPKNQRTYITRAAKHACHPNRPGIENRPTDLVPGNGSTPEISGDPSRSRHITISEVAALSPNTNEVSPELRTEVCTPAVYSAVPSLLSAGTPFPAEIVQGRYRGEDVYEMYVNGVTAMRRRRDAWMNASHIVALSGLSHTRRYMFMEDVIWPRECERIRSGSKYQGTWVSYEKAVEIIQFFGLEELLHPLLIFDMGLYDNVQIDCSRPGRHGSRCEQHFVGIQAYESYLTHIKTMHPLESRPGTLAKRENRKRAFAQMTGSTSSLGSREKIAVVDNSAVESSPSSRLPRIRQRDAAGINLQQASTKADVLGVGLDAIGGVPKLRQYDKDSNAEASTGILTSGGTYQPCGQNGFTCMKLFCFRCQSSSKLVTGC